MPNSPPRDSPLVLLTGASGFVGRHLLPALISLGMRVRCASRDPERARSLAPEVEWVELDLRDSGGIAAALAGVSHAVYLVHSLLDGRGYPDRESRFARTFAAAASACGLERVVYLGGVEPHGTVSEHLRSRLDTGRILREGVPHAVELRASMIIGRGSASWQLVRDCAVRLPALLLPRWFDNRSSPVAVDDVVFALCAALTAPLESGWYDIPGPETVSHRMLLERVGRVLGRRTPMLRLPLVTPSVSAYWLAATSKVPYALARELVLGLTSDLVPGDRSFWDQMPGYAPRPLLSAIQTAIEDETARELPSPATRARILRHVAGLGESFATRQALPLDASRISLLGLERTIGPG